MRNSLRSGAARTGFLLSSVSMSHEDGDGFGTDGVDETIRLTSGRLSSSANEGN